MEKLQDEVRMEFNKMHSPAKDNLQEKKADEEEESKNPGEITVGQYLIRRLRELGIDHVFGVPGDYSFSLFEHIVAHDSGLKYIGTCNELNAANAADAYAKVRKVPGVVAVTYGVGELSAVNGIAGAFVENSPVILLVGAPSVKAFNTQKANHHAFPGEFAIPQKMYKNITVAQAVIKDSYSAPRKIDKAIQACLAHRKPVYIQIPTDIIYKGCACPKLAIEHVPLIEDQQCMQEAIQETMGLLKSTSKPVVVTDADVRRFSCEGQVLEFLDKTKFPFCSMPMGKGDLNEHHPQFMGIYLGGSSEQLFLKNAVETSDCLIIIGLQMVDLNTGGFTTCFDHHPNMIKLFPDRIRIRNHWYFNTPMLKFLTLLNAELSSTSFTPNPKITEFLSSVVPATSTFVHNKSEPWKPQDAKLTITRLFDRIAFALPENCVIVTETGISMFSLWQTLFPPKTTTVSQIFYGSIGYSVGAAVGACAAVEKEKRPVFLFVGDGSFQVTGVDLSTIIRYGWNITVILLNNDGYSIERGIFDGKFNDLNMWNYTQIPEAFGAKPGCSFKVQNETELDTSLQGTQNNNNNTHLLTLIECVTDKFDMPSPAHKMGQSCRQANCLKTTQCNPHILKESEENV